MTVDLKISADGTIQDGILALNGGYLNVGKDTSIASDLQHHSSSEIVVSAGKTLNYTGSDLNIDNLGYFLNQIPSIKELSIGHAIVCDAFELLSLIHI